jgi:Catechol dioxygenase N terminus/Dioxygenase
MPMIIENQSMVTDAVIEAVSRVEDARLRQILLALVRHLHGFVREVHLTEREFQKAVRIIAALGQKTTPSHNEVVLMAGSLGISSLVCLLNNGNNGQTEIQANLLGPFWRDDQPISANGDTLVRSPTPGPALFVSVSLQDISGKPISGAEVDVWHSSPDGLYENQDPSQPR